MEFECSDNDDECALCTSNKCNGNIFPENRLHCLHCEGSTCVNQTNTVAVRYPCVNYISSDSCYTVFADGKFLFFPYTKLFFFKSEKQKINFVKINEEFPSDGSSAYRGCTSDSKETHGKRFCAENDKQCRKCATRGCNNDSVQYAKRLTCFKCNSATDANCKESVDSIPATECKRTVLGYNNRCFTRVTNTSVTRGCLIEANTEIKADCNAWYSQSCELCESSECNRAKVSNEYCYECRTAIDTNCTNNLDIYMQKQCKLNLRQKGCYRISEDENGMFNKKFFFLYHYCI